MRDNSTFFIVGMLVPPLEQDWATRKSRRPPAPSHLPTDDKGLCPLTESRIELPGPYWDHYHLPLEQEWPVGTTSRLPAPPHVGPQDGLGPEPSHQHRQSLNKPFHMKSPYHERVGLVIAQMTCSPCHTTNEAIDHFYSSSVDEERVMIALPFP